jgi:hypothetical protein
LKAPKAISELFSFLAFLPLDFRRFLRRGTFGAFSPLSAARLSAEKAF